MPTLVSLPLLDAGFFNSLEERQVSADTQANTLQRLHIHLPLLGAGISPEELQQNIDVTVDFLVGQEHHHDQPLPDDMPASQAARLARAMDTMLDGLAKPRRKFGDRPATTIAERARRVGELHFVASELASRVGRTNELQPLRTLIRDNDALLQLAENYFQAWKTGKPRHPESSSAAGSRAAIHETEHLPLVAARKGKRPKKQARVKLGRR
jgi:hypothetical protein